MSRHLHLSMGHPLKKLTIVLTVLLGVAAIPVGPASGFLRTRSGASKAAAVAQKVNTTTLATSVKDLDSYIITSEIRLANLDANLYTTATTRNRDQLRHRIKEGVAAHRSGDFRSSAILLLDVVENPGARELPEYGDALFHLADSLFQGRNMVAAAGFFQRLIEENVATYRPQTLLRLIEIADSSNNVEVVTSYYRQIQEMPEGSDQPGVVYVWAKTLHKQGNLEAAHHAFSTIPTDNVHHMQARYFVGVIQVQQGMFKEAIDTFKAILSMPVKNETQFKVTELTQLALARLHYEQGNNQAALNHYQQISKDSPYFERAIHEVCWTFIKQEQYRSALRALEILILVDPDSVLIPEAMVLRGNLLMKQGEYEEANRVFNEIVSRFGPIEKEVRWFIEDNRDNLSQYFIELAKEGHENLSAELKMPPLAQGLLHADNDLSRVRSLFDDLDMVHSDVKEALSVAQRLRAALESDSRIRLFPEIRQGWLTASEMFGLLLDLENKLHIQLFNVADRTVVNPQHKALLEDMKADRYTIEQAFLRLPLTAQDLAARTDSFGQRLKETNLTIHRLTYEIDSIKAQLEAIDKWIADTLPETKRQQSDGGNHIIESINRERANLQGLYDRVADMKNSLEQTRLQEGPNDDVSTEEARFKRDFGRFLDEEWRILAEIIPANDLDAASMMAQVDTVRKKSDTLKISLQQFIDKAERVVEEQSTEILAKVNRESTLLAQYSQQADSYTDSSRDVAGDAVGNAFRKVHNTIYDLMLQADVGLVDVAWRQREDRSNRIDKLVDQRKNELDVLEKEYSEIREGSNLR